MIVLLVIVVIAILYYATPNVKQPKIRWMSIGSLIALVAFLLASLGFGFYVANFANYNKTYGAIGGVIVMLLWLWILNMSLLFGAEFDAEMERGRQLQAGIEAEETIQLPPRDTKKSDKLQAQEDEDIRRGRELREQYEREGNGQDGGGNGGRGNSSREGSSRENLTGKTTADPGSPRRPKRRRALALRTAGRGTRSGGGVQDFAAAQDAQ